MRVYCARCLKHLALEIFNDVCQRSWLLGYLLCHVPLTRTLQVPYIFFLRLGMRENVYCFSQALQIGACADPQCVSSQRRILAMDRSCKAGCTAPPPSPCSSEIGNAGCSALLEEVDALRARNWSIKLAGEPTNSLEPKQVLQIRTSNYFT